jgi:hypothetical protein
MIGGKMKNKEFKAILKEWNSFLLEEKENNSNLKYDGKNIETLGELKDLLRKISKKEKIDKGVKVVKDLADVGINLIQDLPTGISTGKAIIGLAYSLSRLNDAKSEKLDNLKGFDYNKELQDVIKDEVLMKLLKTFADDLKDEYTDDTRLEEININYYVSKRVFNKIKGHLKDKYDITYKKKEKK